MRWRKAAWRAQQEAVRAYARYAADTDGSGGHGTASDLGRFADLRTKGLINEAEFEQAEAKILAPVP